MISLWYHLVRFHMWYHFDFTTQIHLDITCDIYVISLSDISHVISLGYHKQRFIWTSHVISQWYHLVTYHIWYHFYFTTQIDLKITCDITVIPLSYISHLILLFVSQAQIHLKITREITVISLNDISREISLWYHKLRYIWLSHVVSQWYHLVTYHMWYHFDFTNRDLGQKRSINMRRSV